MKFFTTLLFLCGLLPHLASADVPPARETTDDTHPNAKPVQLQNNGATARKRSTDGFIVGGTRAAQGDFPSFVLGNGCGASLIHRDIVLSAAHCKDAFSGSVLVGAVQAGSTNYGAEFRNIIGSMVVHPKYNPNDMTNDYMIFKIQAPTKSGIVPAVLNFDPAYPVANQNLQVCGFGSTYEGGSMTQYLNKVTVPYIDPATCNAMLGETLNATVEMCAGLAAGGKDSCQGDSGGPLFDMNKKQVGVVSWGYGCARANAPGVYSRVSGAKDWINQQICSLSSYKPSSCSTTPTAPTPTAPVPAPAPAPVQSPVAVPTAPVPAPTAPTSTSTLSTITVNVQYDKYPDEFGWKIVDTVSLATVVNYPAKSFYTASKFLTGTVNLVKGRKYKLAMTDSAGDGICCSYGNGYIEVKAGSSYLINIWGNIGGSYNMYFTVP